jgi:transposase
MARNVVAEIRRATRRKFRADDKIRIVLEGLRGEISVSQLCRREVYIVRRNGNFEVQN